MNELNVALCILACKEEPESTWFNNKLKECEKTKHRCVRYERIEGALKHTELVTAEKIFGELKGVCRCDNCFDKIQDKYLGRNKCKELCTLVCKEVAWFHEQFKQCRAACHKCGDYRRLEQRLKMYKGDVLFEVQEEMEKVFGNTPDIIYGIVDVLLKMHHEEAK